MKTFSISALLLFTLATIYTGCRKDDSTLDTNKLPGVIIDTTGMSTLSVYQFDNLVVKPKIIHDGIDEKDLSYSWRLTMTSMDTTSVELGTSHDLDAPIRFNPSTPGSEQKLILTVVDSKRELKYYQVWRLIIYNNIGMGLVVAETDGNGHGDLSHIMSPEVTLNYSGESVKHQVYSSLNNKFFDGNIKRVAFKKFLDGNAVLALTDNSVTRVNTLNYLRQGVNSELFFAPVTVNTVQNIYESYQMDALVVNNQIYATWANINRKFGTPLDNNFKFPAIMAVNGNSANPGVGSYNPIHTVNYYSEDLGAFVYIPGLTQFQDKTPYRAPVQAGQAFNANDLPNKINLAAGITVDKGFLHILKDKTSGAVGFYLFNGGSEDDNGVYAPLPLNYFDLSTMPGIQQATRFEILDDQRVFYYATSNKIYAVMYGGATPIVEERYTAPAGETITTMDIYRHPGYPLLASYISTNNKMLIVSTYSTEGKVLFIPMKNPGLGTLDVANIKTFTGFGKVTAVGPQL